MIAAFEFSWSADVAVPIIIALTLGVALSIYTGLVASRMFAFYQARTRVMTWSIDLLIETRNTHKTSGTFMMAVLKGAHPIMAELVGLGHLHARDEVYALLKTYFEAASLVCGAEIAPNLDLIRDADIPKNFAEQVAARVNSSAPIHLRIASLAPDYWAILTPEPFPVYFKTAGTERSQFLRRSDCGDCCQNCKRVL